MPNKLAKRAVATSPVQYEVQGPADKPTGLMLAVNYEEAPVPQHYYVADWFAVAERGLEVVISFGNRDGRDRLRSRIDVVFPALLFVQQLWRSSREFHTMLAKFIDTLGLDAAQTDAAELATDKVQTLMANSVFMVLSGTECLADFFYISPKDMWSKPRRGERLDLEAVVRVMLSPTLLLGVLNACEPIATHLGQRFGAYVGKEEP